MFALLVELTVSADHRQTLIDALVADGLGSLRDEPGTLRFDLHEDEEVAGRFYLIEAYADEEAFQAHKDGPHYPPVVRALEALEQQGALSTRVISRTEPRFLPVASGWAFP